jgi:hypothetical protein
MGAFLWVTTAVMQVLAVLAYAVVGLGLAFCLLQLFVVVSVVFTGLEVWGRFHHHRDQYGWTRR